LKVTARSPNGGTAPLLTKNIPSPNTGTEIGITPIRGADHNFPPSAAEYAASSSGLETTICTGPFPTRCVAGVE
jgi:hypothetical protein